jgi:hypothetical protein
MKYSGVGLLLLCLASSPLQAREIAGLDVPEQLTIGPDKVILTLNGAGVRSKFFIKVYVGALYLPEKSAEAARILTMPGPKRIAMHFLAKQVSAEKITSGWNQGFANNNPPGEFETLKDRLADFNSLFGDSGKDDVIQLDWVPGSGTVVRLNDEVKGIIPGEDFYRALLRVWLGAAPADKDLKQAMLGQD